MPTSTYKGYELIPTGGDVDTWGETLNGDVYTIIDNNLGGIVTKSISNINVSLTSEESQMAILRLAGTLTGNVVITTECLGFFFVENVTTGAFSVVIRNASISTSVIVPQSGRVLVISDETNGCRLGVDAFPTGTRMTFNQTTAPTGWTKDSAAAYNDATIRTTTGSVSTGGTRAFSTVFTDFLLARNQLPNANATVSGNAIGGSHDHFSFNTGSTAAFVTPVTSPTRTGAIIGGPYSIAGAAATPTVGLTSPSGSLTIPLTATASLNGGVTQQDLGFDVKYIDMIVAAKS